MEDNEKKANTEINATTESQVTNQAASAHASQEQDEAPPREYRRGTLETAKDVILGELVNVASRSSPKLRELLAGTIVISIQNTDKKYLIDWSQPQIKAELMSKPINADCTISVSEDNLLKIANGDLNPQIAMLAQKVKVEGKKATAMYFFNLIAPFQSY